jgi:periplasmic divalent cation tolerance protein
MKTYFTYITTRNTDEAKIIGKALVTERLAACVNIVDGMHSLYWWDNEIQEGHETILIAKTSETKLNKLTERVKDLHSYDCPCVVYLPIENGNKDYINWIVDETNKE